MGWLVTQLVRSLGLDAHFLELLPIQLVFVKSLPLSL